MRQPANGRIKEAPPNQGANLLLHQLGDATQIPGLAGMFNGFIQQPLRFKPVARPLMEFGNLVRRTLAQLLAQHFGKEMMIAIPVALIIKRDDK